jgi:hypothetical protein
MSQEVEVKIKVDTAKAVTDVNKLGDAFDNTAQDAQEAQKVFSKAGNGVEVEQSIAGLKQLKRELKNTAVGSAEFKKLYNDIDDLEDKLKSAKNTSSDWVDSLEQAGGPLGMVGAAINKAKVATQSFGGALKATGIGLIVSLLGGLAVAFSDNEGAMKKIQPLLDGIGKIFQGVFRAVEPLFNTLVDLAINALPMVSKAFAVVYSSVTSVFQSLGKIGGAIGKLISGDFSGAWQDAKSSVNDFGKNYDASIKRFNEGSKELTKTEKDEADKRAEARRKATEKREQDQEKAKQIAIAKAKEEADALKAFQDDVLKNQQQMNVDKVNKDIQDKLDEKTNQEERLQSISDQVDAIDALNQKEIDNAKITADKIAADKKAADDKEVEFQKNKDTAIANSKANLNNIMAGLEASGMAKTKAGQVISKAIALTQIGIDSAVAISKASTLANAEGVAAQLAFPLVPGIGTIARVISYASTAASVIGNISRAKQLLSSGGGGGSGGASSGGGGGGGGAISTPESAQPSINVVGASKTNAIAETIAQQGQQPIKAYVVANDVTTQQGLDRNIVSSASIG